MGQLYSILKKFALFKMRQTKGRHRRLPLEMECQVFECLKLEIQQKLIWGMGRGIYGMFGHQLLIKSKRLHNSKDNHLNPCRWNWLISADGLQIERSGDMVEAFANKGFDICFERCRIDNFPGSILYYFEVTQTSVYYFWELSIGLSDGHRLGNSLLYYYPTGFDFCYLLGREHPFEWPNNAIKPKRKGKGDIYGCGLLLNSRNELAIFFTANGILMGKQIPISPESNHLTPTIRVKKISVKVNFGDNPAKPFKFDITNARDWFFS